MTPRNRGGAWVSQPTQGRPVGIERSSRSKKSAASSDVSSPNVILAMHPDPIIVVNDRQEVAYANPAAHRLFGNDLSPRDLAVTLNDTKTPDCLHKVLGGGPAEIIDFKLPTQIGRHFRARVEFLPAYPNCGAAVLLTVADLTEVKRVEQMRADFVANASHELRTPLAILLGFIETLTGSAADDAEARGRFLPIMHQQAARMARLVDDLLSLSRIELTENAPPTTRLDIANTLRMVVQALKLRAANRGMWIELELADDLPMVVGDAEELAQVFQNLIDNAIKYARPNTGITVTATASAKLKQGVAVRVRDCGDGIARRHLARLTERFYRVDTARSCDAGGTGLGLAIVKHVLTRHRGMLDIESKVAEGSAFTVHLVGATDVQRRARVEQPAMLDSDRAARKHAGEPRRARLVALRRASSRGKVERINANRTAS